MSAKRARRGSGTGRRVMDLPSGARARTMGSNALQSNSILSKTKTEIHHWGTSTCLGFNDPLGTMAMGGQNQAAFGLNCAFAPYLVKPTDITATDLHQPLAFDQMALLYEDFEVISCAYEVIISPGGTHVNGETSRLDSIVAGVYISTHKQDGNLNPVLLTNVREAIERPSSQHKVTYVGTDDAGGVAGGPVLRFTGEVDIKKMLGVSSLGHSRKEGKDDVNPTDRVFMIPWVGIADPDADYSTNVLGYCMGTVVNLTMKIRWSHPRSLGQS